LLGLTTVCGHTGQHLDGEAMLAWRVEESVIEHEELRTLCNMMIIELRMPTSSLFPGYKQVDAFADDDLYEGEEEVRYVTLDLGSIEPTLVPSMSEYQLIVSASTRDASIILIKETGIRYSHSVSAAWWDYF
jgi:hypothetical protein